MFDSQIFTPPLSCISYFTHCFDRTRLKRGLFWLRVSKIRVHAGQEVMAEYTTSACLHDESAGRWHLKWASAIALKCTPGGILLPAVPRVYKGSMPYQAASPSDQVFKDVSPWGIFHIQTTTPFLVQDSVKRKKKNKPSFSTTPWNHLSTLFLQYDK